MEQTITSTTTKGIVIGLILIVLGTGYVFFKHRYKWPHTMAWLCCFYWRYYMVSIFIMVSK